ncbi:MAG: hypothetical protein AAF614_28375 [Chloroflexota bacterium]
MVAERPFSPAQHMVGATQVRKALDQPVLHFLHLPRPRQSSGETTGEAIGD